MLLVSIFISAFISGISIGEVAQKTEEVQAKLEDLLAQFQSYKENAKNVSPIAVKEDLITEQIREHEVFSFLYCLD